jgi:hypothetical protein
MRKNNKQIFWMMVGFLGFIMLAFAPGCGRKERVDPGEIPAVPAEQAKKERMFLRGNVLINGSRVLDITTDIPLYVRCAFFFPKQDRELAFSGLDRIKPVLISENRQPADIRWTLLPPGDTALKPGQYLVLFWTPDSAPPPGKYRLTIQMSEETVSMRDNGISGAKIEPAYLTVRSGSADAVLRSYYERRILLVKGEVDQLLEKIRSALAEDPDNPDLRLELVDALAFSGDNAQAAEEMADLIAALEVRQKELNPDEEPHIPDWMLVTLDKLRDKRQPQQPK